MFAGGAHCFSNCIVEKLDILFWPDDDVTLCMLHHQSGVAPPNVIMSMLHVTVTFVPNMMTNRMAWNFPSPPHSFTISSNRSLMESILMFTYLYASATSTKHIFKQEFRAIVWSIKLSDDHTCAQVAFFCIRFFPHKFFLFEYACNRVSLNKPFSTKYIFFLLIWMALSCMDKQPWKLL